MRKPNEDSLNQILRNLSFAYKVIYVENGLIVLFDKLKRFTKENIKVKLAGSDLILELGHNIMVLTEEMMNHLIATNNLFLYESRRELYEARGEISAFRVDPELLAKIQGAWEVLHVTSSPLECV